MRFGVVGMLAIATSCYREASPQTPITSPPPSRAHARMTASADPLAYLPADADAVIAIDMRAIKKSAVWKQLFPVLQPRLDQVFALFKGRCNFDPIARLDQVSMAIRDPSGTASGVFVVRGYAKQQVIECIRASQALDQRRITIDHGVITIAGSAVMGFADDTTLVSIYGPSATAAQLAEALEGGAPLRMAPDMPRLVEPLERGHAWFVIAGAAKVLQNIPFGGKPVAVTGAANVTSAIDAEIRIRFAEPAQAAAAAGLLQAQLPQLQTVLPGIDISADDVDAVLRLQMPINVLQMLLGIAVP